MYLRQLTYGSLKSVKLPSGVTSIGVFAFASCTSLSNINLPGKLTSIEKGAFEFCTNLKKITLPASLKVIGTGAFYGAYELKNVKVPKSVKTIGAHAFRWVKKIEGAFDSKTGMSIVNGYLLDVNSTDFNITIPSSVNKISSAFYDNYHLHLYQLIY